MIYAKLDSGAFINNERPHFLNSARHFVTSILAVDKLPFGARYLTVAPWRELRRVKEGNKQDEQFEAVRVAADKGDWKSYVQLMGGVFCKRKDLLVRPYYHVEADQQTGLIKTSWFDNLIVLKLKGVLYAGQAIITRLHQWFVE